MKRMMEVRGMWIVFSLLALSLGRMARAQDSDTIPLTRTTTGTTNGDDLSLSRVSRPSDFARASTPKAGGPNHGKERDTSKPYVSSFDTYGSSRVNGAMLKQYLGAELAQWMEMGLEGDPRSVEIENRLIRKIKEKWGFARADFSIVQYFVPGDMAIHITLDVVEPKDVAKRMPFLPAPTGEFKDPDGLIAAWREYEDIALDLVGQGQIEPEAEKCPAFHCPFGHKHPKLKKYERVFVLGVKKDFRALAQIQAQDKRPEFRAAATYLLAYAKDGRKVVSLMVDRIRDPDSVVRNNALRVLGDIAEYHPDLVIPLTPVLQALQFPRTSDRTKAVYVLYLTAMNSEEARAAILKSSFPTLLDMMENGQPDSKEIALGLLRKVSGQNFGNNDRLSWEHWYNKLPKQRLPSND